MDTRSFIAKCATGNGATNPRNGWQKCNRVAWDGETLYSYGTHYPLLITLKLPGGIIKVLNDRGYSATTGKHISYAGQYAQYRVHIPQGMGYQTARTAAGIIEAANIEAGYNADRSERLVAELAEYPRRHIRIARDLKACADRNAQLYQLIQAVKAAQV